jgi:hypothetical protein
VIDVRVVSLDKLIQVNVMGWEEFKPNFMPSLHIEHAMQVEQKLYEMGYGVLTRRITGDHCGFLRRDEAKEGQFFCNIMLDNKGFGEKLVHFQCVEDTLPLAICRSAIKAMGHRLAHD